MVKLNLRIKFQNEEHWYKRKNKAYCQVPRENQNLKQLQINNAINPLQPDVAFLHPLKTSEGIEKALRGYGKEAPACSGLSSVKITINVDGQF